MSEGDIGDPVLDDGASNAVELEAVVGAIAPLLPFELGVDDDEYWNAPNDFLVFFDGYDDGGVLSFFV